MIGLIIKWYVIIIIIGGIAMTIAATCSESSEYDTDTNRKGKGFFGVFTVAALLLYNFTYAGIVLSVILSFLITFTMYCIGDTLVERKQKKIQARKLLRKLNEKRSPEV